MLYLRSRFPSFCRFVNLLALLALLVPAGTTLVHHPESARTFAHICGMAEHSHDSPDKDPGHKLPSCPICQSLHLLSSVIEPPVAVAVAEQPLVAPSYVSADYNFVFKFAAAPQSRPRAPPVLA